MGVKEWFYGATLVRIIAGRSGEFCWQAVFFKIQVYGVILTSEVSYDMFFDIFIF